MSKKNNFKYHGRKGVTCPKVQVDVLSYEPLHKRIERFLSGDVSSLEGADTTKLEYDEPEQVGEDSSVFEPQELRDDILNQPLDRLDIEEIRCDSQKAIVKQSKKLNDMKNKKQNSSSEQNPATEINQALEKNTVPEQNKE